MLKALGLSYKKQLSLMDEILANDERELIELYVATFPDGPLTADERDTRDGFGRAGEDVTVAILAAVPHVK